MNALSLFSGIGVGEAMLRGTSVEVRVANEFEPSRAKAYSEIYPETTMIQGDITNTEVMASVISASTQNSVDIVFATPPCQGMSRAAGIPIVGDPRNNLISPVIDAVAAIKPKYVLVENVKRLFEVRVHHRGLNARVLDLLHKALGDQYHILSAVVDLKDFAVPQSRIRAFILMTRKDQSEAWQLPQKNNEVVTLRSAIGHLPSLDPYVTDISDGAHLKLFPNFNERLAEGLVVSQWHKPPTHIMRQVLTMMHTPTGKTAFNNKVYFPKTKDGKRVRGYLSTYRRLTWDGPAKTITMDNRKISSQNNVHPGRLLNTAQNRKQIYSDARALSIFELMLLMTMPPHWQPPTVLSEPSLRSLLGEGLPPLFLKNLVSNLPKANV